MFKNPTWGAATTTAGLEAGATGLLFIKDHDSIGTHMDEYDESCDSSILYNHMYHIGA